METQDLVVLGFSVVNDILDNLCVDEASYRPRPNAPCFTLDGDRLAFSEPPPSAPRPASRSRSTPGSRAADFAASQVRRLTFWTSCLGSWRASLRLKPHIGGWA